MEPTGPDPNQPQTTNPATPPNAVMDVQAPAPVVPTEAAAAVDAPAATDPGASEGITPVTNDQQVAPAPPEAPAGQAPVNPAAPAATKQPGNKKPIVIAVVIFVVLLAAVLIWHLTMHKS